MVIAVFQCALRACLLCKYHVFKLSLLVARGITARRYQPLLERAAGLLGDCKRSYFRFRLRDLPC
jgi:hypothetical protein